MIKRLVGIGACGVMLSALICMQLASSAYADTDELSELQQQVESTAKDYDDALARLDDLNAQIAENQARLDEINQILPGQQQRSAVSLKTLYILQQEGGSLIDLVLDSESIADFIQRIEYLDCIHDHNTAEVRKLDALKSELEAVQSDLSSQQKEAQQAADRAERTLKSAQSAREEAEQRAIALAAAQAAEAKQQAQEAAVAQVATEAGQDAANTAVDNSSQDTSANYSGTVKSDDVDWSSDKKAFVNKWSGRIDSYLSGSPLAGQGQVFAEAAWDYGVDPRWSPAIAYKESSLGAHCFKPHNAWGWGSSSWSSWDEAIRAHVSGLARIYGSTLTPEAARKYCPPNSTDWYNTVLSQMQSI